MLLLLLNSTLMSVAQFLTNLYYTGLIWWYILNVKEEVYNYLPRFLVGFGFRVLI